MIKQEYLDMYLGVVDYFSIKLDRLKDSIHAVCLADYYYGDNDKKLDFDRFLLSIDLDKKQVLNCERSLPDVQVLRVMCDSLILNIDDAADFTLTMPESEKVADVKDIYHGKAERIIWMRRAVLSF